MSVSRSLLMLLALGLVVVVVAASKRQPQRCEDRVCPKVYKPVCSSTGRRHTCWFNDCELQKDICIFSRLSKKMTPEQVQSVTSQFEEQEQNQEVNAEVGEQTDQLQVQTAEQLEEDGDYSSGNQEQEQEQSAGVEVDVDLEQQQEQEQH